MKTLMEHYTEWLSLVMDQLISTSWQEVQTTKHLEHKHHQLLRCETRMHEQPETLHQAVMHMVGLIDGQLSLTLLATQRMTSYRTSAQQREYNRMLRFRTTLLTERKRLLVLIGKSDLDDVILHAA